MTDTVPSIRASLRPVHFACAVAGLGALTLLAIADPAANSWFPPCPFHQLTGWHCPGCGTLRALHCLLHGQPLAALRFNPLMVISLPFLVWLWLEQGGRQGWGPRVSLRPFPPALLRNIPWIVLAYFLLRNLPWLPFRLLAPA